MNMWIWLLPQFYNSTFVELPAILIHNIQQQFTHCGSQIWQNKIKFKLHRPDRELASSLCDFHCKNGTAVYIPFFQHFQYPSHWQCKNSADLMLNCNLSYKNTTPIGKKPRSLLQIFAPLRGECHHLLSRLIYLHTMSRSYRF